MYGQNFSQDPSSVLDSVRLRWRKACRLSSLNRFERQSTAQNENSFNQQAARSKARNLLASPLLVLVCETRLRASQAFGSGSTSATPATAGERVRGVTGARCRRMACPGLPGVCVAVAAIATRRSRPLALLSALHSASCHDDRARARELPRAPGLASRESRTHTARGAGTLAHSTAPCSALQSVAPSLALPPALVVRLCPLPVSACSR